MREGPYPPTLFRIVRRDNMRALNDGKACVVGGGVERIRKRLLSQLEVSRGRECNGRKEVFSGAWNPWLATRQQFWRALDPPWRKSTMISSTSGTDRTQTPELEWNVVKVQPLHTVPPTCSDVTLLGHGLGCEVIVSGVMVTHSLLLLSISLSACFDCLYFLPGRFLSPGLC